MSPLHLLEPRHRRPDAQPLGVSGVHASDQRLDEALVGLSPEPAAGERGQALVAGPARWYQQLQAHSQLAPGPQDGRRHHRPEAHGRHDHQAVGDRYQPPARDHEGPSPIGVGGNDLVLQPQPPAKPHAVRQRRQEAIGALLDQEAILVDRAQDAAGPGTGLQHHHPRLRRQLNQPMRGRKPGDPSSDDHDERPLAIL